MIRRNREPIFCDSFAFIWQANGQIDCTVDSWGNIWEPAQTKVVQKIIYIHNCTPLICFLTSPVSSCIFVPLPLISVSALAIQLYCRFSHSSLLIYGSCHFHLISAASFSSLPPEDNCRFTEQDWTSERWELILNHLLLLTLLLPFCFFYLCLYSSTSSFLSIYALFVSLWEALAGEASLSKSDPSSVGSAGKSTTTYFIY